MKMEFDEQHQEQADRVFFTIWNTGFEHPLSLEGFTSNGIRIEVTGINAMYDSEISALLKEFPNALLDRHGLALYD